MTSSARTAASDRSTRSRETSHVSATASRPQIGPAEIFKALGDPVRWSIVCQAAEVDELAASLLEDTLDVSKPTISYHTKILVRSGLLTVRKEGRNFFYALRPEVLRALVHDVWTLAPEPRPVRDGAPAFRPASAAARPAHRRRARAATAPVTPSVASVATSRAESDPVLLTW